MRKGLLLGAAIVAGILATAIPASATPMISVSGYDECTPTGGGTSVIHWTVSNASEYNIRLTGSSRPKVVAPDALIGGNMGDYFLESLPPGTPSPQTLTVSWLTADQETQTASASVELISGCTPTPTSPPPTSPPPTTVPPTSPPPTHHTPPTTFTPPSNLATTGVSLVGPALAFLALAAIGMGLLWVTRKQADGK